jgi:hypothetical protein
MTVISVSAVRLMEVKLLSLDLRSVCLKCETALRYVKYEFLILFENCHSLILVFELMLAYTFIRISHLKYESVVLLGKYCLVLRTGTGVSLCIEFNISFVSVCVYSGGMFYCV